MLEIERMIQEDWYLNLSEKDKNLALQSINVGSSYVPIAEGGKVATKEPGQTPTCIMNRETMAGLELQYAKMYGDVFGHDGHGGLFKNLDEIKETVRRTEGAVNQLTTEIMSDRTRNEGKFKQVEADINNLGKKVEAVKVSLNEIKKEETDELKDEVKTNKDFVSVIKQKLILMAIEKGIPLAFIGAVVLVVLKLSGKIGG